jgi:hypothetical protein
MAATGCGLLLLGRFATRLATKREERYSFYVAGCRFYKHQKILRRGEQIKIKLGSFRKERCLVITDFRDQVIGHVPRGWISCVQSGRIIDSYLSRVDHNGLPWKRYEVTVRLIPSNVRPIPVSMNTT